MRGKAQSSMHICQMYRITPACAGKSRAAAGAAAPAWDHPRVCGEKSLFPNGIIPCVGSPPRVRGKVSPSNSAGHKAGITPACAGKSNRYQLENQYRRDHPRVCGEKYEFQFLRGIYQGSPPRVRGKGRHSRLPALYAGITPACAGKSMACEDKHVKP